VIVCLASAEALDRLVPPGHGARMVRVAADEALFVADAATAPEVLREVEDRIAAIESDAVVRDVGDGWAAWTLVGPDTLDGFAHVSQLPSPAAGTWVQGDVARVGAKVLGEDGGLTILVPAYWDEHLRTRLVEDAGATEATA
jgi:glycine cleavage system aminomethyltransferase T